MLYPQRYKEAFQGNIKNSVELHVEMEIIILIQQKDFFEGEEFANYDLYSHIIPLKTVGKSFSLGYVIKQMVNGSASTTELWLHSGGLLLST